MNTTAARWAGVALLVATLTACSGQDDTPAERTTTVNGSTVTFTPLPSPKPDQAVVYGPGVYQVPGDIAVGTYTVAGPGGGRVEKCTDAACDDVYGYQAVADFPTDVEIPAKAKAIRIVGDLTISRA